MAMIKLFVQDRCFKGTPKQLATDRLDLWLMPVEEDGITFKGTRLFAWTDVAKACQEGEEISYFRALKFTEARAMAEILNVQHKAPSDWTFEMVTRRISVCDLSFTEFMGKVGAGSVTLNLAKEITDAVKVTSLDFTTGIQYNKASTWDDKFSYVYELNESGATESEVYPFFRDLITALLPSTTQKECEWHDHTEQGVGFWSVFKVEHSGNDGHLFVTKGEQKVMVLVYEGKSFPAKKDPEWFPLPQAVAEGIAAAQTNGVDNKGLWKEVEKNPTQRVLLVWNNGIYAGLGVLNASWLLCDSIYKAYIPSTQPELWAWYPERGRFGHLRGSHMGNPKELEPFLQALDAAIQFVVAQPVC
eukprot:TRINITY_DN66960_c0_g2_i1.p1 TRINITY_DN66960_c0_g2~~TRINITY_DN66960_c0_g2_i1.p1  ORF type:complete len:359 (+),score=20.34 TRINITY_DN66960_c0_g2_i1:32-1108(+)